MTTKTTETRPVFCRCGCGGATFSVYCPGHDARHASEVAHKAAATGSTDFTELASAALRIKAAGIVLKLQAAHAVRATKAARKAEPVGGTVRIGRWTYPARKGRDGAIVRNTKRDGSGAFAPAGPAAATFVPNQGG